MLVAFITSESLLLCSVFTVAEAFVSRCTHTLCNHNYLGEVCRLVTASARFSYCQSSINSDSIISFSGAMKVAIILLYIIQLYW